MLRLLALFPKHLLLVLSLCVVDVGHPWLRLQLGLRLRSSGGHLVSSRVLVRPEGSSSRVRVRLVEMLHCACHAESFSGGPAEFCRGSGYPSCQTTGGRVGGSRFKSASVSRPDWGAGARLYVSFRLPFLAFPFFPGAPATALVRIKQAASASAACSSASCATDGRRKDTGADLCCWFCMCGCALLLWSACHRRAFRRISRMARNPSRSWIFSSGQT